MGFRVRGERFGALGFWGGSRAKLGAGGLFRFMVLGGLECTCTLQNPGT